MGGPAERKMAIVLAREVEAIWIWETLGVAIAGAHDGDHGLTLADGFATELEIGWRQTRGVLAWAFKAQEFLDGGND